MNGDWSSRQSKGFLTNAKSFVHDVVAWFSKQLTSASALRSQGLGTRSHTRVKLIDFMLGGTNLRVRTSALTKSWVLDFSLDELGTNLRVRISALTKSWVVDFSLDELRSWRFLVWRTREFQSAEEIPSFLLRARRNKQLLAQALSVIRA